MVAKRSAGILLYRRAGEGAEVLLGHMGGPLWVKKDASAWSIPKGQYVLGEELPRVAARREFTEELGLPVPDGPWVDLGDVRYGSGGKRKNLTVWAVEGDLDPDEIVPGTFELEWPRGSGRIQLFPEVDRVAWFGLAQAREKLVAGQRPFLDRLAVRLGL